MLCHLCTFATLPRQHTYMLVVGLLSTASPVPCPTAVETLDASSPDILVCGAYGDPHIIRNGKFMQVRPCRG